MDTRPPSVAVRTGNLADVFSQCHDDIDILYRRFLKRHVDSSTTSIPSYILDARAFLVLANGALEQCCEDLVWAAAHGAVNEFLARCRVTRTLAGLLMQFADWPEVSKEDTGFNLLGLKNFRAGCAEILTEVGKIVHENHGIAPQRLGNLFQPLAVTISPGINQVDSLIQLRKLRGDSAHTRGALNMPPAPEVKRFVYDVLGVARKCAFNVSADIYAAPTAVRMCVEP